MTPYSKYQQCSYSNITQNYKNNNHKNKVLTFQTHVSITKNKTTMKTIKLNSKISCDALTMPHQCLCNGNIKQLSNFLIFDEILLTLISISSASLRADAMVSVFSSVAVICWLFSFHNCKRNDIVKHRN